MPLNLLFLAINMENLMAALAIMGKGMLGIFVVIGLLAVIVYILTKFGNRKKKA
ncbi:hypothetical protein [Scatolibacter rhodanostii]|uniref:hypothetical protein n=1 Tax=Scatolibacter rhodanostii TaxID=2014781 RepID=UPI001FA8CDC7|nr:hypothetical protein [Scatolibacter rhodanostii]